MLTTGPLAKLSAGGRLAVLATISGVLAAALVLPAVAVAGIAVRNAANKFNTLATPELGQLPVRSAIMDDRGHVLAYYYPRGIDRVPVAFNQISPVMRHAIVAIEDSRFYQHGALDFRGTVRALINNLQHKPIQGGSTLTQQYVKNVLILSAPNPQQAALNYAGDTVGRKIRELRMAVRVEHTMSRDQILAGYLNAAYYGNSAYGIQVAAQRYFGIPASKLDLRQAAMLAGIVENPSAYDPAQNAQASKARRNVVLARMAQLGYVSQAQATKAGAQGLGLHMVQPQSGCTSQSASYAAFFCDYVLAVMRNDAAYKQAYARLTGMGGLKIYTTLSTVDQRAANNAVNYQLPPPPSAVNPARNADTEVLVQPGTGYVRAIAINRPYGTGPGQTTLDYAVGPRYHGTSGVQIGSTGKVYTMVAALKQGVPFGYSKQVGFSTTVSGYSNCAGQTLAPWHVHNDESERGGNYTLYTGTTASINVYFAYLEQKVGLCNVVKTAAQMGLTWPDGRSLLRPDRSENHLASADNNPSFTLGADNVAPIDVAAADATLPARGIYCHPIPISKIRTVDGTSLPVESAGCHRVLSTTIADAANYILQGDLTGLGTASRDAIGRPAASKTGTADNYMSAFFVGYTPDLLGAVWVGNPTNPKLHPMLGYPGSCYRAGCVGSMYGSEAPGQTWQQTFQHANLANPPQNFVAVPLSNPLFSMGNGQSAPRPPKKKRTGDGGGGGGHGGGGGGGGHGPGTGGPPPNGH
ncbi:MAG TPA: transglycosylase domain-containing protein [Streptosporangiaceae bacterium]|nr:transglycosylase domain-containing protein [Streptosporangiaceae bacterium]